MLSRVPSVYILRISLDPASYAHWIAREIPNSETKFSRNSPWRQAADDAETDPDAGKAAMWDGALGPPPGEPSLAHAKTTSAGEAKVEEAVPPLMRGASDGSIGGALSRSGTGSMEGSGELSCQSHGKVDRLFPFRCRPWHDFSSL